MQTERKQDPLPLSAHAVTDYCSIEIIAAVAKSKLIGSRLRKAVSFHGREIVLSFDIADRGNENIDFSNWLISSDPALFRIHPLIGDLPGKTIREHFSGVISHHLMGAKIEAIKVLPFERVIIFTFSKRDYAGEENRYRLIAELMGKYSNVILTDEADVIIACAKTVHSYQSRAREVRPGGKYFPPPKQDRVTPEKFDPNQWGNFIRSADIGERIDELLLRKFHGMSSAWAETILARAEIASHSIVEKLGENEIENLRTAFSGTLDFITAGIPLTGESAEEFTLRYAREFSGRAEGAEVERKKREIGKFVSVRLKKLSRLESALADDLEQAGKAESYKRKADLILGNLHNVLPGAAFIEAQDWSDGSIVRLPIDPNIPPHIQAEKLYGRYRKLKRTMEIAKERMRVTKAELEEIGELSDLLGRAISLVETDEIRERCIIQGLIPPESFEKERDTGGRKKRKPGNEAGIGAIRYRSNDGFLILAGTSGKSNDALRRMCRADDIWLHVRDVPGSHVFIVTRDKAVPETTLLEAAMVAAWHSKAREGANVQVDYTRVKYLSAIPGGPPGKVRFRRERTIRVTPDAGRIEMMKLMAGDGSVGHLKN